MDDTQKALLALGALIALQLCMLFRRPKRLWLLANGGANGDMTPASYAVGLALLAFLPMLCAVAIAWRFIPAERGFGPGMLMAMVAVYLELVLAWREGRRSAGSQTGRR